jgi:DNA-binding response OmpR family regulator
MPVIILSGSGEAADINTAYENRANCYVKKRFDHREMKAAIVDIRNFWLRHAAVPASISN